MIRKATIEDIAGILTIYNDAILHTTAIYDYTPHTLDERTAWFKELTAAGWPLYVYEAADGAVAGFADYGSFRNWPAYKYTVEHSIYVHPDFRRQGIARALLGDLQARYKSVELNAFAHQVPWFESMAMQVVAASGPQVLMSSTGQASGALIGRLDIAPIYQTAEVLQIHTYLLNQQGEDAMIEAEQMRDERLDALTAQAQECVRQRQHVH